LQISIQDGEKGGCIFLRGSVSWRSSTRCSRLLAVLVALGLPLLLPADDIDMDDDTKHIKDLSAMTLGSSCLVVSEAIALPWLLPAENIEKDGDTKHIE